MFVLDFAHRAHSLSHPSPYQRGHLDTKDIPFKEDIPFKGDILIKENIPIKEDVITTERFRGDSGPTDNAPWGIVHESLADTPASPFSRHSNAPALTHLSQAPFNLCLTINSSTYLKKLATKL